MIIKAKIKTNQPSFSVEEGPVWRISVRSSPEKNKANQELAKEMSRLYGTARILSGFKSKTKVLEISEKP